MYISLIFIPFMLFILYHTRLRNHDHRPLPPGPTFLQIIIEFIRYPGIEPWRRMREWSFKHGPILSFRVGTRTVIVLGNNETINNLLVKRGNEFNDRPRLILLGEYVFRSMAPGLIPYGPKWQTHHRHLSAVLNLRASRAYENIHYLSTRHLLFTMLNQKDLVGCFNLYTQNTLSTILYGNQIGSLEESDAKELFDLGQMFLSFIGFEYSVLDIFSILERLPGVSSFLTKKTDGIFEKLLQRYEKSLKLSIHKPTWNITQALHRFRNEDLNWKEFCIETGESELAGAVTLSLSIATMTKFAAQHPEETQKVQREIDKIVGPDRAPTTEDLENLPFLQAFINECFRLEQPAPFGLPRAAIQDEEYMGYRIPAGAFIFSNQWAIGMEESVFEEPASFRPQRWLDKSELPEPAVFGFGTRGCPGKWVAKSVIHIAMAGIFWGFEFKDNGNAENSNIKARSLFASPDLSDIQCSHRSPAHKATIERQWRETNTDPSSILNEFGTSLGQGNARKMG